MPIRAGVGATQAPPGGFPGPLLMIADLRSKSSVEITRPRSLTGASKLLTKVYETRRG